MWARHTMSSTSLQSCRLVSIFLALGQSRSSDRAALIEHVHRWGGLVGGSSMPCLSPMIHIHSRSAADPVRGGQLT